MAPHAAARHRRARVPFIVLGVIDLHLVDGDRPFSGAVTAADHHHPAVGERRDGVVAAGVAQRAEQRPVVCGRVVLLDGDAGVAGEHILPAGHQHPAGRGQHRRAAVGFERAGSRGPGVAGGVEPLGFLLLAIFQVADHQHLAIGEQQGVVAVAGVVHRAGDGPDQLIISLGQACGGRHGSAGYGGTEQQREQDQDGGDEGIVSGVPEMLPARVMEFCIFGHHQTHSFFREPVASLWRSPGMGYSGSHHLLYTATRHRCGIGQPHRPDPFHW